MDMIEADKNVYWEIVEESLVKLYGLTRFDSKRRIEMFKTAFLEACKSKGAEDCSDVIYHEEPWYLAKDIGELAGRSLIPTIEDPEAEYEKILSQKGWA